MMFNTKKIFLLVNIGVFWSILSYADLSYDAIPSGGIIFQPFLSKDIKLKNYIVRLGANKVEVEYHFINESDKEIQETATFPLPPTPSEYVHMEHGITWDKAYYALAFLDQNAKDFNMESIEVQEQAATGGAYQSAPFVDFSLKINDENTVFYHKITAISPDGKDITATLRDNKIPISATFLTSEDGMYHDHDSPIEKNVKLKQQLESLNLLDKFGIPIWKNQITYFWKQVFPPKKIIKVLLSYNPAAGFTFISLDRPDKLSSYCINPKLGKHAYLTKPPMTNRDPLPSYGVFEVAFLNGFTASQEQIEHFRLEIMPTENTEFATCFPMPLEKRGEIYIAESKNYHPTSEIKVYFINKIPFGQAVD